MSNRPDIPSSVAAILRGEAPCPNGWESLAEVGQIYYQEGKDGVPYTIIVPPAHIPLRVVELVERFCMNCWELGQADREEAANQ